MAIRMEETKLTDSFTLFLYAFSAPRDLYKQILKNTIWKKSSVSPNDPGLFAHINDFFIANSNASQETINENRVTIFELKSGGLNEDEKVKLFLYQVLFKRVHVLKVEDISIEFNFIRDVPVLSPKLIFVPLTGTGFLTFGIRLSGDSRLLHQLVEFNYHIVTLTSGLSSPILTRRNPHEKAWSQENRIDELLSEMPETWVGEQEYSWRINNYISYLLSDFEDRISCSSPGQLHVFTYANLAEDMDAGELELNLFRLRRIYSSSYNPASGYDMAREEMIHHFEKVYHGVSAEGAVVIVRPDDQEVIKNYAQTILNRNLWIYFLVLHQRFALQNASAIADSEIFTQFASRHTDNSELIEWIDKVKFLCRYERITHNTLSNKLYNLCRQNLGISELSLEVDAAIRILEKKKL